MAKGFLDTQEAALCCGCSACADICPREAIRMEVGYDKAMYPRINLEKCIHCGVCRNVCPIEKPLREVTEFQPKAFALVQNEEHCRMQSSSGGAFEIIAAALEDRYPDLLIAGAAWDSAVTVRHKLLSAQKRAVFRKSKYLQSDCAGVYKDVKAALERGMPVLFTGTPCQVAALKRYVGTNTEKLFTVDLVCHGVPGADVFLAYTRELEKKYKSTVVSAGFREKRKDLFGEVHSDYLKVHFADGKVLLGNKKTDAYLRGFHKGIFYRESCYSCPYAAPERASDITIGDFWHIQSLFSNRIDYTGVSAVLVNTEKGAEMFSGCRNAWIEETDPAFLIKHNGCLRKPTSMPQLRTLVLENIDTTTFSVLIDTYVGKAKILENYISKMIPGKIKRWIKNRGYKK